MYTGEHFQKYAISYIPSLKKCFLWGPYREQLTLPQRQRAEEPTENLAVPKALLPARGGYCPRESFFTVKLAVSSSLDGAVIRKKAHGPQRAMCGVTQSLLVTPEPVVRCCVLSLGGSPWLFTGGFSWGLPSTFSLCPGGDSP